MPWPVALPAETGDEAADLAAFLAWEQAMERHYHPSRFDADGERLPTPREFTYYLGVPEPSWLGRHDLGPDGAYLCSGIPKFVSAARLARYRSDEEQWPVASACTYAIDSGAYIALTGGNKDVPWYADPDVYGGMILRFMSNNGYPPDFCAPQDFPCEPQALAATGLTVRQHQELTLDSYRWLDREFPMVPWIPVLQGQKPGDHDDHANMYADAGIDLAACHRVGVGSICRLTELDGLVERIRHLENLAATGLKLHGFGIKTDALPLIGHLLASADSMAWSYNARRTRLRLPGCTHVGDCRNCYRYAVHWREQVLARHNTEGTTVAYKDPHPGQLWAESRNIDRADYRVLRWFAVAAVDEDTVTTVDVDSELWTGRPNRGSWRLDVPPDISRGPFKTIARGRLAHKNFVQLCDPDQGNVILPTPEQITVTAPARRRQPDTGLQPSLFDGLGEFSVLVAKTLGLPKPAPVKPVTVPLTEVQWGTYGEVSFAWGPDGSREKNRRGYLVKTARVYTGGISGHSRTRKSLGEPLLFFTMENRPDGGYTGMYAPLDTTFTILEAPADHKRRSRKILSRRMPVNDLRRGDVFYIWDEDGLAARSIPRPDGTFHRQDDRPRYHVQADVRRSPTQGDAQREVLVLVNGRGQQITRQFDTYLWVDVEDPRKHPWQEAGLETDQTVAKPRIDKAEIKKLLDSLVCCPTCEGVGTTGDGECRDCDGWGQVNPQKRELLLLKQQPEPATDGTPLDDVQPGAYAEFTGISLDGQPRTARGYVISTDVKHGSARPGLRVVELSPVWPVPRLACITTVQVEPAAHARVIDLPAGGVWPVQLENSGPGSRFRIADVNDGKPLTLAGMRVASSARPNMSRVTTEEGVTFEINMFNSGPVVEILDTPAKAERVGGPAGVVGDGLDEVREILAQALYDGTTLALPLGLKNRKLPRPVWEAVHTLLTGMGATGGSRIGQPYRFDTDRRADLAAFVAGGSAPKHERTTAGWVPTPDALAADVVARFAELGGTPANQVVRMLEPSAGTGALIRAFLKVCPGMPVITAIEPSDERRAALNTLADQVGRRKFANITGGTLEEYAAVPATEGRFTLVLMNPPYSVPGNRTIWIDHVRLAWGMLAAGGRLVAIVPGKPRESSNAKVRSLLEMLGPDLQIEELPARSFRQSGTDFDTCVIAATKLDLGVEASRRRFAGSLCQPAEGEPVRVDAPALTAADAQARPVQGYRNWGGEQVLRFVGKCIVCTVSTWSHDSGDDDPRGAVGLKVLSALRAEDFGLEGPEVCLCYGCADSGIMFNRGLERARTMWTDPECDDTMAVPFTLESLGAAVEAALISV